MEATKEKEKEEESGQQKARRCRDRCRGRGIVRVGAIAATVAALATAVWWLPSYQHQRPGPSSNSLSKPPPLPSVHGTNASEPQRKVCYALLTLSDLVPGSDDLHDAHRPHNMAAPTLLEILGLDQARSTDADADAGQVGLFSPDSSNGGYPYGGAQHGRQIRLAVHGAVAGVERGLALEEAEAAVRARDAASASAAVLLCPAARAWYLTRVMPDLEAAGHGGREAVVDRICGTLWKDLGWRR